MLKCNLKTIRECYDMVKRFEWTCDRKSGHNSGKVDALMKLYNRLFIETGNMKFLTEKGRKSDFGQYVKAVEFWQYHTRGELNTLLAGCRRFLGQQLRFTYDKIKKEGEVKT